MARPNLWRTVGLLAVLALVAWMAYVVVTEGLTGLIGRITPPQDWQVFTGEAVILMFALLAPLVPYLGKAPAGPDRAGMQQFALIGLAGGFLITLATVFGVEWGRFSFQYIDWSLDSVATGHLVADVYRVTYGSQVLKLLFLGAAFAAVLAMGRPLKGKTEEDYPEFVSLLLFATLGMMIVASAQELFVLFLGIEMTSMSSYLLASFRRDRIGAEAGLKYFVIGAISSGLVLFSISLLYGMAGTTRIAGLATLTTEGAFDAATLVPIVLLLGGLGFKISSVPFHAWAPDAYAGAPVPVAGLLASASKAMGFVAIAQVFLVGLFNVKATWQLPVALLAVASMFVGNLVALQQQNLRRMLAYSSIAQAGYLLIAIAVGTQYALGGAVFHLMVNAAMKLGAFVVVGALLYVGIPDQIEGVRGLGKRAPLLALAMTVFLLSMAGLPPFGGFASKWVLFGSAVDAGVTEHLGWLLVLALLAVLSSAISLFYYLRVIRAMYVDEAPDASPMDVGRGVQVTVALCLVAVLLMGFWPQPFIEASMKAASSLLGLA